jgi:hypothetical protein
MKSKLIIVLCLLLSWHGSVTAQNLERLLTSLQQREQINQERLQAKMPKPSKKIEKQNAIKDRRLSFEALLKTEKGYSVWLNGRMYDQKNILMGIQIDPNQMYANKLWLKTSSGTRALALGQVYWIDQDKVLEPYEKP